MANEIDHDNGIVAVGNKERGDLGTSMIAKSKKAEVDIAATDAGMLSNVLDGVTDHTG